MRRMMKTIILTWGSANRGKSQSLKNLAVSLPFSSVIKNWHDDDYDSYVIGGILDNDGKEKMVGVVSLGDPGSIHMTWINDCVKNDCEVIVAACRSYGATYDNAKRVARENDYVAIEATTLFHDGGPELPNGIDLRVVFAENMRHLIMECLRKA